MAEPIKSALLLDYESLNHSLGGSGGTRLADRAAAWVAAIETGRLIGPEGTRRHFVEKRCYAGPSVRGKQRDILASAGFEVVDYGGNDTGRTSADLHMAMDTFDLLNRPNGPEEFIILSGASDLSPLLTRLKAAKRNTVIYAGTANDSDKSLTDAVIEADDFNAFLASDENPAAPPKSGAAAGDRADIEAFARKIHAATNIPLFSPKTFAELFRHLTEEIREHGYHFQMTAKNVADRMTADGRNVTRRQVVFIVKGLALKGHVFSTGDTAERLAEVFREQAHYLITNAGVALDEKQERLLSAWFLSKPAATAVEAPPPKTKATPETRRPVDEYEPTAAPPPPERPKQAPARPTASAKPPQVKPVDLPSSAAKAATPSKAAPPSDARDDARTAIAARIAASAKIKPGSRAPAATKSAPKAAPADATPAPRATTVQARPAPPAGAPRGFQQTPPPQQPDALEDSILAAIAEAVDVLVEDGNADERASNEQNTRKKPPPPPQPAPAKQVDESDDAESGDIGDQIQRIIASYTRNREE